MYAAIRQYRIDPALADEVIPKIENEFAPLLRKLPGFVAYHLLQSGEGTIITMSVFEDRAKAKESNRIADQWRQKNLGDIISLFPRNGLGSFSSVEGTLTSISHNSRAGQHKYSEEPNLRLLSVEEISEMLGMGRSWIYQQIRSGEMPSVQLGGSIKVKREDLQAYIENRRRASKHDEEE